MGLFDRLKQGLKKTTQILKTDVRDLFKAEGRLIDQPFLDEMRAILFKTDMGYDAVEQIVEEVATNFRGRVVTLEQMLETWKQKLKSLMAQDDAPIRFAESGPTVIMVCGVNGSGKTTTIAKLAQLLPLAGKESGPRRRRHVPRRGGRAAHDLERPDRRAGREGRTGQPTRRASPIGPWRRRSKRGPMCASSIRPAGCKRRRTSWPS